MSRYLAIPILILALSINVFANVPPISLSPPASWHLLQEKDIGITLGDSHYLFAADHPTRDIRVISVYHTWKNSHPDLALRDAIEKILYGYREALLRTGQQIGSSTATSVNGIPTHRYYLPPSSPTDDLRRVVYFLFTNHHSVSVTFATSEPISFDDPAIGSVLDTVSILTPEEIPSSSTIRYTDMDSDAYKTGADLRQNLNAIAPILAILLASFLTITFWKKRTNRRS